MEVLDHSHLEDDVVDNHLDEEEKDSGNEGRGGHETDTEAASE
jgi:hypothetical protein